MDRYSPSSDHCNITLKWSVCRDPKIPTEAGFIAGLPVNNSPRRGFEVQEAESEERRDLRKQPCFLLATH